MKNRLFAGVALLLTAVLSSIGPALAQDLITEVVDELIEQGFYVEPGAENTASELRSIGSQASDDGIGVVLLADEVDGSAQDFADDLVDAVVLGNSNLHTVMVITPGELGIASNRYSAGQTDRALLRFTSAGGDAVSGVEGVYESLVGSATANPEPGGDDEGPARDSGGSSSSGDGIPLLPVLGVGAVGAGGAWLYSKRKADKAREQNLEVARSELNAQVSGIAQMVYDLNDRVTLSDDDDLMLRFQEASIEYNAVNELLDGIDNGPDMAELNDRVDQLRWRLDQVEAKLDGRPLPPEPVADRLPSQQTSDNRSERVRARHGTCFFDPDHRPGTVPAIVDAGDTQIDVLICRECARRIEAGDLPEPRLVQVGQRRVPAARAPLGYGGIGLALPDLFRILTRSSGRPIDVDWRSWPSPNPVPRQIPRRERLPRRRGRSGRSRRASSGRRR
ncbi:MAG: hypothetical protein V3V01_01145 [Acidimicrobiales bacterium]